MTKKHQIRAPVIALPEVVAFPWTIVHLEINDPDHIRIIKESLKSGGNFVIVQRKNPFTPRCPFSDHARSNLYKTGTIGRPIVIDEKKGHGLKLVFKGQERVIIGNLIQNLPIPIYDLELCPDRQDKINSEDLGKMIPRGHGIIERLANLLHNWGERNILDSLDRENFFSNMENINHLINNISSNLIKDPEIKQILLETLELQERIQILAILFPHEMVDHEDLQASCALKEYEAMEMKMIKSQ